MACASIVPDTAEQAGKGTTHTRWIDLSRSERRARTSTTARASSLSGTGRKGRGDWDKNPEEDITRTKSREDGGGVRIVEETLNCIRLVGIYYRALNRQEHGKAKKVRDGEVVTFSNAEFEAGVA